MSLAVVTATTTTRNIFVADIKTDMIISFYLFHSSPHPSSAKVNSNATNSETSKYLFSEIRKKFFISQFLMATLRNTFFFSKKKFFRSKYEKFFVFNLSTIFTKIHQKCGF